MLSGFCPASFGVLFYSVVDHAVIGAPFLTGGVFECEMYKIRCNPMHPLNDALPGPYVPVRITRGAQVAHRYTYPSPRFRTSQCLWTFVPLSVSLWNNLADPVFDGLGLAVFEEQGQCFFIGLS